MIYQICMGAVAPKNKTTQASGLQHVTALPRNTPAGSVLKFSRIWFKNNDYRA